MSLASVLPFLAALKQQQGVVTGPNADPTDTSANANAPSQVTLAQNTQGPPMGPPVPPPDQDQGPDMNIGASHLPFVRALQQQQQPEDSLGDIASAAAPTGKAAQPKLAKGTQLMMLLQRGLMGGLSGLEANAQTYAATGRNAGFGGGAAGAWQMPLQQRMMGLDIAGKIAGIGKTQAETQQAQATIQGMPIKQALEQAQTEAAYYKDDPNMGLIDIRTGQPVSSGGIAPLTVQEAQVLGKQPGERVPIKVKNQANEMVNRGIRSVSANGRQLLVDNQGRTIQDLGTATPMLTTQTRIEGMGQMREYPVLDTKNSNSLQYISAADLNKANQQEPGRYIPAGEGGKALNKTALIEDIRGNIQSVRQSLQNPQMPEFDAGQRAQLAIAMNNPSPTGAVSAMLRGGVIGNLTPEQQDYVIHLSQLVENSMAMRSVLGSGQGSEDMRSAIRATIPNPATPTKQFGVKQLDAFEAVLNRLSRGVPTVPLKNAPQQPAGGGAPTHRYNMQTGKIEPI